jgi:hypothetical protein
MMLFSPRTTRVRVVLFAVSVGADGVAPSSSVQPENVPSVRLTLLYQIWSLFTPRTTSWSVLLTRVALGLSIVVPEGTSVQSVQV